MRLHLYVTGRTSSRSRSAMATAQALADQIDDCELEITDVIAEPDVAEDNRVMITPTLDLRSSLSTQRIVGEVDDVASGAERLGLTIDQDATLGPDATPEPGDASERPGDR